MLGDHWAVAGTGWFEDSLYMTHRLTDIEIVAAARCPDRLYGMCVGALHAGTESFHVWRRMDY